MWDFLGRQLLKGAGRKIGGKFFNDELNGSEVYADRIKRDFHLDQYADAWALYDSDRDYWKRYYNPPPADLNPNNAFVRDSAAAAGVPSRNNVFEYGFPEPTVARDHFDARFGEWGSTPARRGSPAAFDRPESFGSRFGNWGSVPVAPLNEPAVSGRPNSFADRFGSWSSPPESVSTPGAPNWPGSDPHNPNRPAPLPLDDDEEQADLRALDAKLSGSGNIRDAVALYKARRSSRR